MAALRTCIAASLGVPLRRPLPPGLTSEFPLLSERVERRLLQHL